MMSPDQRGDAEGDHPEREHLPEDQRPELGDRFVDIETVACRPLQVSGDRALLPLQVVRHGRQHFAEHSLGLTLADHVHKEWGEEIRETGK